MIVKLLAEHHLEFLSSKGGCRGPITSFSFRPRSALFLLDESFFHLNHTLRVSPVIIFSYHLQFPRITFWHAFFSLSGVNKSVFGINK